VAGIFLATRAFDREFDGLFDFVGASTAAMWNMRWQVRGYKDAHPNASQSQLIGHFVAGSRIGKFKFKFFTDSTWEQQEAQIARMALVNVIALYEGWLEGISPLRLSASQRRRLQRTRARQICEAIPDPGDAVFANAVLELRQLLAQQQSSVMEDLYGQSLSRLAIYSGADLSALLAYYRFFKEIRNLFMHGTGDPNQYLLGAAAAVSNITYKPKRASRAGNVVIPHVAVGVPPVIDLSHAFFACHIVRSLVRTLDIELALTKAAEDEVAGYCAARGPVRLSWRGSEQRAVRAVREYFASLGYPRPSGGDLMYQRLLAEGSIKLNR
jgi:hypothetical protein